MSEGPTVTIRIVFDPPLSSVLETGSDLPREIPNFPEFDTVSEGYWDFPEWMKRLARRFTHKHKGE